jgi:hypothetical protein
VSVDSLPFALTQENTVRALLDNYSADKCKDHITSYSLNFVKKSFLLSVAVPANLASKNVSVSNAIISERVLPIVIRKPARQNKSALRSGDDMQIYVQNYNGNLLNTAK